ncbi:hypothetical protein NPIL_393731 [Nephila pilipes]|uniref:Uncharacterized protein n=1 Tax=Nephila pilipes TaxID=299642 RepID=A0A8X6QH48_NEPPI|nr:hypothetical protein NPIL_393731 [Nephila pilipes]
MFLLRLKPVSNNIHDIAVPVKPATVQDQRCETHTVKDEGYVGNVSTRCPPKLHKSFQCAGGRTSCESSRSNTIPENNRPIRLDLIPACKHSPK